MKKITVLIVLFFALPAMSKTISGEIKRETPRDKNIIYDVINNSPVAGATVKLPSKHYSTITDKDGTFQLGTHIDAPTIMSVEKDGYKPYSISLSSLENNPISIGIEKTSPNDIIIETDVIHLGDDSYSYNSAHSYDFSLKSMGAFYSKEFRISPIKAEENVILSIGSIIGIDTPQAIKLGQSNVRTSYSSPPEIFCNGNKIAEIKINGDNQKIHIPSAILKGSDIVNITIKTGRNLFKQSSIDFDDIEFTNLILEIK